MLPLLIAIGVGAWALSQKGQDVKPIDPASTDPTDKAALAEGSKESTADPDAQMRAALAMIQWAEGTSSQPDPYATTYGYGAPLTDLSSNPWDSGQMNPTDGPSGSTQACGAYQFEPQSFLEACRGAGISSNQFDADTQDAAAIWVIENKRKAGDDIRAGRLAMALEKLSYEWASLPPARYPPQRTRSYVDLCAEFTRNGGTIV